ncbi:L-lysine 2,3-aminomutase [Thioalkalivibrio sp. ALE21]|uniref:KamA family radical SAM protein n=1 Tax=Thioalkalivibrio sp. ALE21 TaxID=1158175 RepID=UPI000D8FA032|nr:lysine 2,3-aminomutase [Thioalkalivibrio sp. ALE21]PYG03994.1 L-lysine 2,3-aminomutase [Thioalkalivibrio sp. ALE21]
MNSVLKFYQDPEAGSIEPRDFKVYNDRNLDRIEALERVPEAMRFDMRVVASVLPFRINEYVIDELIDWDNIPDDPMFQLTFPQREMLSPEAYERMAALHRRGAERKEIAALAKELRDELNPHPAGQMELNRPSEDDGEVMNGLQHKYRETVLFFPSQGQTCHSYCTFCFRWAQFVGDKELRIASTDADLLHQYLRQHPAISDLLMTGGDPMVMKTRNLRGYLEALLEPGLEHVQTVRIGTKALSFWPYRFVTESDADDLLRLLEQLVEGGKHVALMAHYNHLNELRTPIAREAIRRVRDTGAEIRAQGPLLRHINDDPQAWADLWREQVRLGIIPYYMFVERDTGARRYFEVPLARAWEIYREAMQQVSGLARTARGPSMSADPGKVEIQGVTEIHGEKVFVLRFIQGRNPDWVQRPFFARYDENATWLNQLKPAFGEEKFFFEDEFEAMKAGHGV